MTNMFKKSLVALALTGLAGTAAAGNVSTTGVETIASEWAQTRPASNPGLSLANEVSVTLGARYRENDLAIFTFTGAPVIGSQLPQELTVNGGAELVASQTLLGAAAIEIDTDTAEAISAVEGASLTKGSYAFLYAAAYSPVADELNTAAKIGTAIANGDLIAVADQDSRVTGDRFRALAELDAISVDAGTLVLADARYAVIDFAAETSGSGSGAVTLTGVQESGTFELINESVSGTESVVTYRVSTGQDFLSGSVISVPSGTDGFVFNARALESNISLRYTAETAAGQPLDTVASNAQRTATLIRARNQFAGFSPLVDNQGGLNQVSTNLTAQIDVATGRLNFAFPNRDGVNGTFVIEGQRVNTAAAGEAADIRDVSIDSANVISEFTITHELTGDFSWLLEEDSDGELVLADTGILAPACLNGSLVAASVAVEPTSATFACEYDSYQFRPTGRVSFDVSDNDIVIPAQSFSLTSTIEYGPNAGTSKSFDLDAGAWTLNGSEVMVPYLPFAEGFSQVLVVTNDSAQAGDITVEAITESGEVLELGVVAEIGAYQTKRITPAVVAALAEQGITNAAPTQRVALRIITNAPDDRVTVHSAYRRGSETTEVVVNTSN